MQRILKVSQAFSLVLVLALGLHSLPLTAAVPQLISYQGQLNQSSGQPVTGSVSMVFSLYEDPLGGAAVWSETQSVSVSNGVFSVQLGAVQQLPSNTFSRDTLYLGIKVGADAEMTPRQRLTSTAFSFRSEIGVVPLGAIVAWHKSLVGMPALPDGWAECNGQVLSDSASPFHGQSLPNLNGNQQFLAGAATSGGAKELAHSHSLSYWGSATGRIQDTGNGQYTFGASGVTAMSNPVAGSNTSRWNFVLSNATLGSAFSIVWIIRVK